MNEPPPTTEEQAEAISAVNAILGNHWREQSAIVIQARLSAFEREIRSQYE